MYSLNAAHVHKDLKMQISVITYAGSELLLVSRQLLKGDKISFLALAYVEQLVLV